MAVVKKVMEMEFPIDDVPDFGSIRMIRTYKNNVREYILNSADVEKLNIIYNANDGSTAYCVDTGDLYIMHMGEWKKAVGGSGE